MRTRRVELFAVAAVFLSIGWAMDTEERHRLRDQVKSMFYHGYRSYMKHAYPADELMPLSCKGRFRGIEENRGDIDDALGNFSLTLVDSADTLVVMNELDEFERAVRLMVDEVKFDSDIVVSVFETNIRVLGGLLSNHILSTYIKDTHPGRLSWYDNQLLAMAKELGLRLLPSFNSTTGIPHPRINLRSGMESPLLPKMSETCTACAGTMILEFAALSRLTGEPVFEAKARKAMDYLWLQRHRSSDLVGTIINVDSGDWIRRDSGVGAGIDSYYEYCLKGYILLGDDGYLERFDKHYEAVMKYISQGPMLVDVHMHRPNTNSKNFMDALLAFWPGLQVLKGDIKPAIETHEMLYQVMQRHTFLPEAFTTDFQVHWGQHPLRPEFVESTYFLYKATGDPYYLEVGRKVLDALEQYTRVPCGYAAVKDVRTNSKDDRMDSFVLAETFKYLYLLFADREDIPIDIDKFVFTTEAHLLPLSLSQKKYNQSTDRATTRSLSRLADTAECPNSEFVQNAEKIRLPLKNLVEGTCPSKPLKRRRLLASQFDANNSEHLELIHQMGVHVSVLGDGRVQLVHNAAHASSQQDAQEGLLFMQEMIQLAKQQNKQEQQMRSVLFTFEGEDIVIPAGPAQFGPDLGDMANQVTGEVVWTEPRKVCSEPYNCPKLKGKVALLERGECMFIEKARHVEKCGAIGAIVFDTTPESSVKSVSVFAMSGDGGLSDPHIPVVFLFSLDAEPLLTAMETHPNIKVTLGDAVAAAGSVLSESSVRDGNHTTESLEAELNRLLVQLHDLQSTKFEQLEETKAKLKALLVNILAEKNKDLSSALAQLNLISLSESGSPSIIDCDSLGVNPNPLTSPKAFISFISHSSCNTCPTME